MYDLFISYATTDGLTLARAVFEMLRKKYLLDIFMADEEARTGESLDNIVRSAITESKQLLVLFTQSATESRWVKGEVAVALNDNKRVITCRSHDVAMKALPPRLEDEKQIVFTGVEDLLDSLEREEWGIPLIIPAAGKSGGLFPLNIGMPKILLPVGEKPILHHIIDKLDSRVFSKVIILTKQFSDTIGYYARFVKTDIPIKCIESPASTLPMALKMMSLEKPFVLHYSDIIIEGDFDWGDFLNHHKDYKRRFGVIGTLMASANYKLPVGRIKKGRNQLIDRFIEKPDIEAGGNAINMAVSIFEPEFLDGIRSDDISLYGDSLKRALEIDKKRFCIYDHDRWRHIQTLTDWYEAQNPF
ncbi:MAG TPA: sugar phosphate nucleotidyltransferase [Blastocatellia bacterium]|nr:sugar phosphate nucleotidyltransferase [Blastocatellia bacterium]